MTHEPALFDETGLVQIEPLIPAPPLRRDPVTRPSGKVYRPLLPPTVETIGYDEVIEGLVVVRTHDIGVAQRLAERWIEDHQEQQTRGLAEGTVIQLGAHALTWYRVSPVGVHEGELLKEWRTDPVRGVPVVTFDLEWQEPSFS